MLIVQICYFGNDGDARYRLHEPVRHLGRMPGVTAMDCHFLSRHLPELADLADVLVMQFVNDWDFLSLIARRRSAGKVTVFEANDYFFDIQPWNPIASGWLDRNIQELYLQMMAMADGVQTSSEALAERWRRRGAREVAVFHNHLTEVAPLPPEIQRPLTIGWAGSPGHFADWYQLVPTLQRWLAEHPDVHLAVMTNELAQSFFQLPANRYHFTPFGSLDDYLRFLRSLDIGVAPLLPTEYNRCRSDVKFLEYSSQGVAGIYADLEPYRATIVPGETGLLYRNTDELVQSLDRLRTNVDLRQKLRRQAHSYVVSKRLLSDNVGERLTWYRNLLKGRAETAAAAAAAAALPNHIIRDSVREEGYVQLRPQEPESVLLDTLTAPAPVDSAARLARVLAKHPDYVAAMQHQGKLLNDRREHRAALEVLERARALRPDSARTWAEIGRARYRLDEEIESRQALEQAIALNERYMPAWQYLLRLLGLNKSPEGPQWARRGEALFPTSYPIALLGVGTYPPEQAPTELLRVMDHFVPTAHKNERSLVIGAFRDAIVEVIRRTNGSGRSVLEMLRRACVLFPESPRLAGELGAALYRAGHAEEAHEQYARALELRRRAAVERSEFNPNDLSPYVWQFADQIVNWVKPGGNLTDAMLTSATAPALQQRT